MNSWTPRQEKNELPSCHILYQYKTKMEIAKGKVKMWLSSINKWTFWCGRIKIPVNELKFSHGQSELHITLYTFLRKNVILCVGQSVPLILSTKLLWFYIPNWCNLNSELMFSFSLEELLHFYHTGLLKTIIVNFIAVDTLLYFLFEFNFCGVLLDWNSGKDK